VPDATDARAPLSEWLAHARDLPNRAVRHPLRRHVGSSTTPSHVASRSVVRGPEGTRKPRKADVGRPKR
jgi:hypothetical protein